MLEPDPGGVVLRDREQFVGVDTEGGVNAPVKTRAHANEHCSRCDAVIDRELCDAMLSHQLLNERRSENCALSILVETNFFYCIAIKPTVSKMAAVIHHPNPSSKDA